jgi:hypothetical protein
MNSGTLSFTRRILLFASFFIILIALSFRGSVFFLFLLPFAYLPILALQLIIAHFVDQKWPTQRLRIFLHLVPALIFAGWFIWNYNYWRIPEILFREHIMHPIPTSVTNLKAYEAELDISWRANIFFEITNEDFSKILAQKNFRKIEQQDPRFQEIIDSRIFFWQRKGWGDPNALIDPELYHYPETEHVNYYLLTNRDHTLVFFQKHQMKTLRKYLDKT